MVEHEAVHGGVVGVVDASCLVAHGQRVHTQAVPQREEVAACRHNTTRAGPVKLEMPSTW